MSDPLKMVIVKAIILFTVLFLLCAPLFAQGEPQAASTGIEEVYLAKDDGKGKAGEQVMEFRVTDVPIYCVILLESNAATVIKMNFVAVAVSGVKPETKVVTATYTTKEGQNRVNFTGRPDGRWTAGKYRVDLFLNGKLVKNVEFMIRGTANTMEANFLQPAAPAVKPRPKGRRTKP